MPADHRTRTSREPPPRHADEARTLPPTEPALTPPAASSRLDAELGVRLDPVARSGFDRESARKKPLVADALGATYRSVLEPEYVVGPRDDRVPVPDTRQTPWRQICSLRIHLADGAQLSGTAWFIGPRTLMTAGHCVFPHIHGTRSDPDYRYDDWANRIEIYPGADGFGADGKPRSAFTPAVSRDFAAPEAWWADVDEELDLGAIFVEDPPADWSKIGHFAFAAYGDADLETSIVNVSGYPTDRNQPHEAGRQWTCAQKVVRVSRRRLYYEVDTFGGQSGAPVFIQVPSSRGKKTVAVGIHNYGDRRGIANAGARITPEIFGQMKEWKARGT